MADVNTAGNVGGGAAIGTAIAPGVGTLVGAGLGLGLSGVEYLWNKHEQKKDEANRPKYQIPPEVAQGLSEAERQALQGLPEAQKQQYITNLQRGTAYGLSQIGSRKGGLAGLGTLNEQQNQGYANLLSQDSAARMQKQQNVFGQLQNVADYKGQAFQINQENPFYENRAISQNNRGALIQNVNKSLGLASYGGGGQGQSTQGQYPVNNQYNPFSVPSSKTGSDNYNLGDSQYSNIG